MLSFFLANILFRSANRKSHWGPDLKNTVDWETIDETALVVVLNHFVNILYIFVRYNFFQTSTAAQFKFIKPLFTGEFS